MIDIKAKEEDYKTWSEEAKKYFIEKGINPFGNAIDINAEVEAHRNELVINVSNAVVRLDDCVDGEDDYYYVFEDGNGQIGLYSCVGRFYPLKGYLPEKDYNSLVYVWNLNHVDQAI